MFLHLEFRPEVTHHVKQVAQLWQRDRAKLDTFSINVQRYSQKYAQNWIFGPPYGGIKGNIYIIRKSPRGVS